MYLVFILISATLEMRPAQSNSHFPTHTHINFQRSEMDLWEPNWIDMHIELRNIRIR